VTRPGTAKLLTKTVIFCERLNQEAYLESRSSHTFGIPEDVRKSWDRVQSGSASGSDITRVLGLLRKEWAVNSADPRALGLWLLDRGLRLEALHKDQVSQEKSNFEQYRATLRGKTIELVRGIASSGSSITQFFYGIRTCSAELREIAFRQALSNYQDEFLILVFSLLSLESRDVIYAVLDIPPSSVVTNFCEYLQSKGIALPSIHPRTDQNRDRASDELDFLFNLASVRSTQIRNQLSRIPAEMLGRLIDLTTRVFNLAPKDGYGESVRYQLAVFLCVADPENPIGDGVIGPLQNGSSVVDAELLTAVGKRRAREILVGLLSGKISNQNALASAVVLDLVRLQYPEILEAVPSEQIVELLTSTNTQLALSAHAAAVLIGRITEPEFLECFEKRAKTDKTGQSISWLTRNAQYIDTVRIDKIPYQGWKSAIESLAAASPMTTISLLRKAVVQPKRRTDLRFWDVMFTVLARIESEHADELFMALVMELINENPDFANTVLAHEPALSLLWRNIWRLSNRAKNKRILDLVFNLVAQKISETSVLAWLRESVTSEPEFRNWVQSVLIPRLLAQQLLSTNFLLQITDPSLQASLIKTLSLQVVESVKFLQKLAREWPLRRDKTKGTICSRASVGLRIAIRAAQQDPVLSKRLTLLLDCLKQWEHADSPPIDASLLSVSTIELSLPKAEGVDSLASFFSSPTRTPHEVAYFFGVNSWAVDVYLANHTNSSWPSLTLLVPQIISSLIYFTALKDRCVTLWDELDEAIRIELAITLRDGLAEIDETVAGYLAFRQILADLGLKAVDPNLGGVIPQEKLSSEEHKLIRDPSERGRHRLFGFGLKVGDRVIGSARVMKSGDEDDRN